MLIPMFILLLTGWQYDSMSFTTLQCIGLAAFPFSFVSLALGSMVQQHLRKELADEFTLSAKAWVSPFFLVVSITKVWIMTDTMCSFHMVHPLLSPLPPLILLTIQLVLHNKMGINRRESVYSSIGNLSSMRRPEAKASSEGLFRAETIVTFVVYSLMVGTSFVIRFCGIVELTETIDWASPCVSLGLLILNLTVTQSYLRTSCLKKTLFSDDPCMDEHQENIELSEIKAQVETKDDSVGRQPCREEEAVENSSCEGDNVKPKSTSLKWFAVLVIMSLLGQAALVAYFGHQTGNNYQNQPEKLRCTF